VRVVVCRVVLFLFILHNAEKRVFGNNQDDFILFVPFSVVSYTTLQDYRNLLNKAEETVFFSV